MASILTNKFNLPETIVKAMQYDTHKVAGDISVTQLIDAPQVRMLKRKNVVQEDASEMIWALFGTAVHHILERANIDSKRQQAFILVIDTLRVWSEAKDIDPAKKDGIEKVGKFLFKLMREYFPELDQRYIFETTLRIEIRGKILYGTFDLYDKIEKRLKDYKVCSVWAFIYPESKKKYFAQLNTYAHMLRNEGYEVLGIDVIMIFRDWSASQLVFKGDYPPQQIMQIELPVHPHEVMNNYLVKRMDLHIQAENGNVPECTGTERWSSASEWAALTPKLKRAIRRFDSEAAAMSFKVENQHLHKDLYIEHRPGEDKRCDKYCPVRDFCPQRKAKVQFIESQKKK